MGNVGEEEGELQKTEYFKNEKNFLDFNEVIARIYTENDLNQCIKYSRSLSINTGIMN